ncbi:BtrH N-terminal domain-containing protein [Amycolatopsis sp. 195334CR]|uniref:BtrH N-terminal domain-containing protein n=1 Tax=Amycolatopsis sp. 195334CR TaxID=2814588 RepID=UPI0027DC8921|nr:BtrH N-terminal domain-containing protein [Amycolatopsis sp. 195334CR]
MGDQGHQLRGGIQPDVSAVTNVLAGQGFHGPDGTPLSEALVFACSGGIGAGYILWEFQHDGNKPLVLGFRGRWQYPQAWLESTVERLGVPAEVHTTGGAAGAAQRLTAELAAGHPAIVLPDRYLLGYWHLPASTEAMGGHFVVAYGEEDGRVLVDDRNLAPLTVERAAFDRARSRVVSYQNLLVRLLPPEDGIGAADLRAAVRGGLTECAERLSAKSASFSLPAWAKWARLLTDEQKPKGWPTIFADRGGLTGTLLSIWDSVTPAGMTGGSLRGLFAASLAEAAVVLDLPELAEQAHRWQEINGLWHQFADTALDPKIEPFARMRDLASTISGGIFTEGDAMQQSAGQAAAELWMLRAQHDAVCPLSTKEVHVLFQELGTRLRVIHEAETAAIGALRSVIFEP